MRSAGQSSSTKIDLNPILARPVSRPGRRSGLVCLLMLRSVWHRGMPYMSGHGGPIRQYSTVQARMGAAL